MSFAEDPRLQDAKDKSVEEVLALLQIYGLRRSPNQREMCGACPSCGDAGHNPKKGPSDRFNINLTTGAHFCRRCDLRGGDVIALVQNVQGGSFVEALTFLCGEKLDAETPEQKAAREKRQSEARAKAEEKQKRQASYEAKRRQQAIKDGRAIWFRARKANHVATLRGYLTARGLGALYGKGFPPVVRYLPDHPYVKSIGGVLRTLHRGPCMIAGIHNADGVGTAVHQTWIDPTQPGKKARILHDCTAMPAKMVRGSKKGGAIRLVTPAGATTLVMGEGIETTLSAYCADAVPGAAYWAGVDLGNMAGKMARIEGKRWSGVPDIADIDDFVPPAWCRHLIYIMDGDSNPKATRAKLEAGLARAAALRPGLIGTIVPAGDGVDLNDVLMGAGGKAHG